MFHKKDPESEVPPSGDRAFRRTATDSAAKPVTRRKAALPIGPAAPAPAAGIATAEVIGTSPPQIEPDRYGGNMYTISALTLSFLSIYGCATSTPTVHQSPAAVMGQTCAAYWDEYAQQSPYKAMVAGYADGSARCFWHWGSNSFAEAETAARDSCIQYYHSASNCYVYAHGHAAQGQWNDYIPITSYDLVSLDHIVQLCVNGAIRNNYKYQPYSKAIVYGRGTPNTCFYVWDQPSANAAIAAAKAGCYKKYEDDCWLVTVDNSVAGLFRGTPRAVSFF